MTLTSLKIQLDRNSKITEPIIGLLDSLMGLKESSPLKAFSELTFLDRWCLALTPSVLKKGLKMKGKRSQIKMKKEAWVVGSFLIFWVFVWL